MSDFQNGQGGGDSGQPRMNMPNMDVIKGLLAIIVGIIAIALAYKVIIGVLSLFLGLLLVYYGMAVLKLTWITRSVDDVLRKLRGLFR